MTRKDYELLAAVMQRRLGMLQSNPDVTRQELDLWYGLAVDLAKALIDTSPRFNEARFLRACGFEDA